MRTLVAFFSTAALAVALVLLVPTYSPGQDQVRRAFVIEIEGAIGPATARHVKTSLATASSRGAELVVLRLNTPGGLVTSMREIVADVMASPVPVIGHVAPSGAHAASAGTYILYATHLAAMAPGTNIGAASPVQLGGTPGLPGGEDPNKDKDQKKDGVTPSDASAAKAMNDLVAFIRSLAELRNRNPDWAEKAVREAATLSATAALQERVIEIVADSREDLLAQADGREVTVAGGRRRLVTRDLVVEVLPPGWLKRLLSVITDPNVALILMMLGVYGLLFEFMSPGMVAPGVIGGICLVLGLYALNLLPIDYTGLALIMLGLLFLAAETFTPSFGILGFGGFLAFLLGAAILIDVDEPGFRLSWGVILAMAGASVAFMTLVLGWLVKLSRVPPRMGADAMLGRSADILDWSGGTGHVFARGERWKATSPDVLIPGETAEVTAVDGLTLTVRRPGRGGNS